MDVTRPAVVGLGLVTGAVAAIGMYAALAPAPTPVHAKEVVSTSQATFAPKPRPTVVEYAPCKAPAKLVGQECVTTQVVTRVIAAPAAPAPRAAASQPGVVAAAPAAPAAAPAAPAAAPAAPIAAASTRAAAGEEAEDGEEHGDDHDGDEGGTGEHPGDD